MLTVGNMKSADYKEQNYQFKTNINMKTKTSILALTKAFFILLVSCCLYSCGNEPPVINDKNNPFIVGEISQKSNTHSIYYKNKISKKGTSVFGSWYEAIVLPTGMYNVGDTIRFSK